MFEPYVPRAETLKLLALFDFKDDAGLTIEWTNGQIEIIDCILHRSSKDAKKRIQIICSTRYGKSLAVAAGVLIRAVLKPEKWAIIAGTKDKAQIIMDYVIMFAVNNALIRVELDINEPIDRLRQSRRRDRLTFRGRGEIRVFSANSSRKSEVSKALMGFGSPNIIEDEAALVPDPLQATVMRMLADSKDNFLVKIGNPFTRGHFLRTWRTKNYYKVFIDYVRGIAEGRYTEEFINEMKQEDPMLFDINFGCLFPDPSAIDESGWMHLFTEEELTRSMKRDLQESGVRRLGVDVARGGRDSCALVMRANNYAKVIKKWKDDDNWSVAEIVKNTMFDLGISAENVYVDDNGVGGGVTDILKHWGIHVVPVNFGDSAEDKEHMLNCRSECYAGTDGLFNFVKRGAKLEESNDWYEGAEIRYKKDFNGKIKMESKEDMRRRGMRSPDVIDALALTFAKTAVERYYRVDPAIINSSGVKPYFEGMPG